MLYRKEQDIVLLTPDAHMGSVENHQSLIGKMHEDVRNFGKTRNLFFFLCEILEKYAALLVIFHTCLGWIESKCQKADQNIIYNCELINTESGVGCGWLAIT